uniref:glucosyltransferase domain-containing protein n=1 Tax=Waltera intestinalis TaxID=2606635 RepID=UPI003FEE6318
MEKYRETKTTADWNGMLHKLCGNRLYMGILLLTAVCAYGYKVTNVTIGIDDTPSLYYFEEGLIAIVGRWVLFLLNKVISLAEFAPFVTDFAAVLLLIAAAIVWSALFYSVFGEKIPVTGYAYFAAVFVSCPLISEVFTYFLHNGIAIGYLSCAVSLCCMREWQNSMRKPRKGSGLWEKPDCPAVTKLAAAAVFLWIAMGCYESFMILWLAGLLLLLLSERIRLGTERTARTGERGVFGTLAGGALAALAAVLLRSLMIVVLTKAFHLEYLQGEAVQRSVTEMLGWMVQTGAFGELIMILKRTFVLYGVFAYAYLPIRIFVLSAVVITVVTLVRVIRGRDLWALILLPTAYLAAFSLLFIEGKATLYRSAQFLPIFCGYGVLLFVYAVWKVTAWWERKTQKSQNSRICRGVRGIAILVLAVIVWNQCMDMTKWFYIDKQKYDAAVKTVDQIALDLEQNFDTSKPVIFTGDYEIPYSMIQDAYVSYGSTTYFKMKRLTDLIDPDLLDKYNRGSKGVWVAQTPALSVIDWGRYAFDSDAELVKFFAMHGHSLVAEEDISLYEGAEKESLELPHYPQEGYIVDKGDYIIVHF